MTRNFLLALLSLGALAPEARAQEYLDRGTFIITRGGSETGRVEYAVRATSGQGQGGLLVFGTTRTPAHEVVYSLEVTRELTPVTYQMSESNAGHIVRRVSAQVTGNRFSARASTEGGDVARELPVRTPFVVLGSDDYTFYFFLPRPDSGSSRNVNLVRTESLSPISGSVTNVGNDSVTIGSQTVGCRRYELRLADGEVRQFCMTATGALLRVTIPSTGVVATLSQAPAR